VSSVTEGHRHNPESGKLVSHWH